MRTRRNRKRRAIGGERERERRKVKKWRETDKKWAAVEAGERRKALRGKKPAIVAPSPPLAAPSQNINREPRSKPAESTEPGFVRESSRVGRSCDVLYSLFFRSKSRQYPFFTYGLGDAGGGGEVVGKLTFILMGHLANLHVTSFHNRQAACVAVDTSANDFPQRSK